MPEEEEAVHWIWTVFICQFCSLFGPPHQPISGSLPKVETFVVGFYSETMMKSFWFFAQFLHVFLVFSTLIGTFLFSFIRLLLFNWFVELGFYGFNCYLLEFVELDGYRTEYIYSVWLFTVGSWFLEEIGFRYFSGYWFWLLCDSFILTLVNFEIWVSLCICF